ncbi:double-strand break repair helicase AddA [Sphingomonas sp. 1P08PE]|uniref:double-strand break repair helicase AddA n=1 Tax=Sphingomonas sp. 1P08PE TaxID=554122 RepID=UPI0039A034D9
MAVIGELRRLPPLKGDQRDASDPTAHVWLAASAGTGKTQVLAARVFRLLMRGTDPAAILCLTFTKAGAAEMAQRVAARLAAWVRMPATELAADLQALGEDGTPTQQAAARTLFAKVLDAPGGGLRIQTIHGFCQSLLAAFPVEADLAPGFRPLEAREEAVLAREALATMLADAEREGRSRPVDTIGALSLRLGEGGAESFLHACAKALPALEALPSGIGPWLRRALELPTGDAATLIAEGCEALDEDCLRGILSANRQWATKNGHSRADAVAAWLAADAAGRAAGLAALHTVWAKADGDVRSFGKGQAPNDPDYASAATFCYDHIAALLAQVARIGYADLLAAALEVGRDYARAYQLAKRRVGGVDFDDLIRLTVDLLGQPGIGEWVRFKLDRATEHVLIDEAQDTNLDQWRIVDALAEEFFVGRGIHAPGTRTLFTVGDWKQAIFGFQGTSPLNFAWAEGRFRDKAALAEGSEDWPEHERGLPFRRLSLTHSFRSTRAILRFVDEAVAAVPEPGLGAIGAIETHASEVAGPGSITLWPPVVAGSDGDEEEGWITDSVRRLAGDIARQVRRWLYEEPLLLGSKGRVLRPEDVMILVKRRGDLASLVVARLYAEKVPVAGVDRLRLNAPLAVQDLLAAIRFVLQPQDDLSLASLLVSPLIGWSQDELMQAAPRDGGSLWRHLTETQPAERLAPLYALLNRADFTTPYQLLEEILSGPLGGRHRLLERLGAEARDPIDELVGAALTFESGTTPSLQRFLDWFDRGDVEIVRDPSAPLDAVRVMTAHGAKGLQAPLVILADACVDPTLSPRSVLRWAPEEGAAKIPVFAPRSDERGGPLDRVKAEAEARELEEHWRLFYVAATRAEERLVVAGALGPKARGVAPAASWYAAADQAMTSLGVPAGEGVRHYEEGVPIARMRDIAAKVGDVPAPLPAWVRTAAPDEPRPSRPLAPSTLGDDLVADPPPDAAMRAAAERGRLLHALFERLPPVPPQDRTVAADRWLRQAGGIADAGARAAIIAAALAVIDDPAHAALFGDDALAEAPIAATLGDGTVIAGKVDRLLIGDTIRIVDFKTGRRVPDVPPDYHLRQMAGYAAALSVIFPDRPIEASLLYTAGPVLMTLTPDDLARHKPGYPAAEQS